MKYIAIIVPNGELTYFFSYYFYGATIEVVDYENGKITDIRDVKSAESFICS